MLLLHLLLAVFLKISLAIIPTPRLVVQNQVAAFQAAVAKHDTQVLLKLFETTGEDNEYIGKLIEAAKMVNINVYNVEHTAANDINADLIFWVDSSRGDNSAQWALPANSASPTGWRITGIQQVKSPRVTSDRCHIGIFKCFVEFVAGL
ncbi:DUF281 domain-containing protein [Caenorhabditis elegans]|uniref:DUF281 domain-containing protein n=1 Tax=Caenorhabditis elegans TaxID=6239 RepID=P91058_CAEEL|nr:DUF281 domain-containing protein [Caenorhabditis elegans]CCD64705.2 DUF281 domain-containing protein [Caenorhabditis elegans]